MKTPEEIKRGLKQCYTIGMLCDGCPYEKYDESNDLLALDANTYIEHLEKRASLNTLRDAIYEDAVKHGLWESTDYTVNTVLKDMGGYGETFDPDEVMRSYAVQAIHWELIELQDASDNAEAYAEELADVIIASLSVAGKIGIDIDAAVRRKMEINKARPWKHVKEKQ